MEIKTRIILLNICLNIAFYGLIAIIVYYGSPLHESFHYIPCKLTGLSPEMSYFSLHCDGIAEKNHIIQFFYFMGPYISYTIMLMLLYFLSAKYKYLKYLMPFPVFDIIYNYMSSPHASDFRYLLQNTYPNMIPFIVSILLVIFISIITVRAYFKYKIYSFGDLIKNL